DVASLEVLGTLPDAGVLLDPSAFLQLDLLHQVQIDARLVVDHAIRVGAGHNVSAQRLNLLHREDRHVPRTRDEAALPLQRVAPDPQHLLHEDRGTVARRFGADGRTAPSESLPGDHPRLPAIGDPLVLAEEVADLARAHPDVARGDVRVLAEVTVQFRHEALTEAHDLRIRPALRIEVGATLPPADRQPRERVLE